MVDDSAAPNSIPRWLEALLQERFFNACLVHENERHNEDNAYCLDCCVSLCPHCLPSHANHHSLQIRRYVYQDVLRLKDAEKLMDCHFIQPYTTNNSKVLFINQKPATTQHKGRGKGGCKTCGRSVQKQYRFCSISCKVSEILCHVAVENRQSTVEHETSYMVENEEQTSGLATSLDKQCLPELQLSCLSGANSISCSSATNSRNFTCSGTPTSRKPCIGDLQDLKTVTISRRKNVPRRSPLF